MHRRVAAMVAAVGVVVLAGCSSPVSGAARQTPYQPLPLDTVTASMATPVGGAVAYSRDGSLAATSTDAGLCIRPADRAGAGAAAHRVCAELGAPIGQVLFSPDGTMVAALEDMAQTFRGRLWLISTDDGVARRVASLRLSTTGAKPPASTDESTPSTSDSTPSTTESIPPTGESATTGEGGSTTSTDPPYVSIAWTARGSLLAIIPSLGPGTTHLAEIDPTSDRAADLGSIAGKGAYAAGTLLTGGGIAVLPVISSGTPHRPQLVVVDLDSRSLHTVALTGDMVTASTRAVPLALAPDGRSALLWMVDPVTFAQWPPVWADLDTGALTVVPGTEDLLPDAAAVSPDGSQLALIARGRDDDTDALRLLSVDGGTSRTLVTLDQPVTPGNGLAWTRTNLLVPGLAAGMHSLNRIAPIQLSG